MEILRPLVHLGKELTVEAGKGFYNEVVAPELALSQQQQQVARMRSKFNQKDLIALMQVEMEEEILQAQIHAPARMAQRMFDLDPQMETDMAALGDVRFQLAQFTQPTFQEPQNATAMGVTSSPAPEYTPATVSTMDAGYL